MKEVLGKAGHLLDLDLALVQHVVVLPGVVEVLVQVCLEFISSEMQVATNQLPGGLVSSISVDPELRRLSLVELVGMAAVAVASAVLRHFPKVELRLAEATLAIASAINSDNDLSAFLAAESVALGNKHIHQSVVTILGVPVWQDLWLSVDLSLYVHSDISVGGFALLLDGRD